MANDTPTSFPNSRQRSGANQESSGKSSSGDKQPKISLPKGGGAIQGIGEKFQVNPVTGTGSLSIPIAMSPGRSGFTPQLALSYDSGAGNSPFGLGWNVGLPAISRKTQKGLPKYLEGDEEDTFILSGVEDLVSVIGDKAPLPDVKHYTVKRYRPRIEGLFARIEKWTHDNGQTFWKSISKENITTIYGQNKNAQIFDPYNHTHVFQWLIERTFDDKGNIVHYEYKAENEGNVPHNLSEHRRSPKAQKYVKRVSYGNTKPYLSGGLNPDHIEPRWDTWLGGDNERPANTWLFQLVFDYGDHLEEEGVPVFSDGKEIWPCRLDAYSIFRSQFDIRTYRLCRRILMFHNFRELGNEPYLVRSTDLEHDENHLATKLESVSHTSYRKNDEGGYEKAAMPATEFLYTKATPDFAIQIAEDFDQHIDGSKIRWIDLKGEGRGGLLIQSPEALYYQPTLGFQMDEHGKEQVLLGSRELLLDEPAGTNLRRREQQLIDLSGDGQLNLVIQYQGLKGHYEIDEQGHWKNFQAFKTNPNVDWNDPNLRLIDLTGDGLADILITEQDCFIWYPSEGEAGFGAANRVEKALNEDDGPQVVFQDGERTIHLADMTGDGLVDIVRIRKNDICYWPNQGFGKFGAKVQMDHSPAFEQGYPFNPGFIHLADIDGSGNSDIVYFGNGKAQYWHNEAGNSWSVPIEIPGFPPVENISRVGVHDLLSKGTAQLVWSSPLSGDEYAPVRYIDLMPEKPHLMIGVNNNMGAVTNLEYESSSRIYTLDEQHGKPWITKIHFPVHVLVRQETHDEISGNTFASRYAYHHGYFDGEEREFRGFGMVEQWDTEDYTSLYKDKSFAPPGNNWSEETDVPPVYTKTWFHTGAFIGRDKISKHFEKEYYQGDSDAWLLDDTILPDDLSTEEQREACRALKGSMLRQEVYAADGSDKTEHPYTVTENSYEIQCLQPDLQPDNKNSYAVFLVTPKEAISYHYERNPEDPRVAHSLNLVTDRYGNSTHAVSVVYPRRGTGHPEEQTRLYATLTESLLTHPDNHNSWYRHSLPVESRTFEVHGLEMPVDEKGKKQKFACKDLRKSLFENFRESGQNRIDLYPAEPNKVLDYTGTPSDGKVQLRLLNRSLIRYAKNSLDNPLDEEENIESLAVPYESYSLAFTPSIMGQEELAGLISTDLLEEGGYLSDLNDDPEQLWWIPSGKTLFFYRDEDHKDTTIANRFYLPVGERTPLGKEGDANLAARQESYVWYDHTSDSQEESYHLFVEKAEDPLQNTIHLTDFDYRVLQARAMEDINGNRSEVIFDIRGMVIATAMMGKEDETNPTKMGDSVADYSLVPPEDTNFDDILENPHKYLQGASTFFYYDLFAWMNRKENKKPPNFAIGLSREVHFFDGGEDCRVQRAITYSDGFGREILRKVQAEDGDAPTYDENRKLLLDENDNPILTLSEGRWVGNGRIIFNNKGKLVKQYEPFFDSNPYFTEEESLVYFGVTPIIYYDPLGRVIKTTFPDDTLSKVEFTPWIQITFDQNDMVKNSNWYEKRISGEMGEPARQAAKKAAIHHKTPSFQFLDTLGRPFVSIAHNRYKYWLKTTPEEGQFFIPTRTKLDIEGNPFFIFDGRNSDQIVIDWAAFETDQVVEPPIEVIEHKGNQVMFYRYAMGGMQLYQNSMDAGKRWSLVDVLGYPIHDWDERGHHNITLYDALQRPTNIIVETDSERKLVERFYYGEELDDMEAKSHNLKGQLYLHFDGAGMVQYQEFDFKGNLFKSSQRLAKLNISS